MICATVSASLLAQPASGILHSVVNIVCHCPGVKGLLLSCLDQGLGVRSDVAFIEPLICTGHVEAMYTRLLLYLALSRWRLHSAISGSLSVLLLK